MRCSHCLTPFGDWYGIRATYHIDLETRRCWDFLRDHGDGMFHDEVFDTYRSLTLKRHGPRVVVVGRSEAQYCNSKCLADAGDELHPLWKQLEDEIKEANRIEQERIERERVRFAWSVMLPYI